MKKSYLLYFFLICHGLAFGQKLGNDKSAEIISFRIESINPGISDNDLLLPLEQQLSRLFRFTEVYLAPEVSIQWKSEYPFNKFKKLNKSELRYITSDNSTVLLKIEIAHRYNQVLGGLIKKGRRHVMRLKIVMFTSSGEKVWYHKKKDSCCIDLGVDDEYVYLHQDMDATEFLDLYKSVVDKAFNKL